MINQRRGFSLLEVIIATGILAASAVMLMSMFSTGDRHTRRADERTMAQMLCQSKLDELIANPSLLVPIPADVIPQYPGWVWSLAVQPTKIDHFFQITVSVTRLPGMETGADLELAATTEETTIDANSLSSIPTEPTYALTRWVRFDGEVSALDDPMGGMSDSGSSGRTSGAGSFSGGGL